MTRDPIRAALRDAETAWRCAFGGTGVSEAIAAFHRRRAQDCRAAGMVPSAMLHDDLAEQVERAAKEGSDA